MSYFGYAPYVSVAEKRGKAEREIAKLRKKGQRVSPVAIEGRKIAREFWGKAWCDNLEHYADFANRLPRGRSYVCNGLLIDLSITRGKVEALVYGSEIYKVNIDIALPAPKRWQAICQDCAGSVGSLVELLQGKFSKNVMERVCRAADGLFPAPKDMKFSCSCPDWADLCKHVAATLYGVGARLDTDPDVLFTLRGVNRDELISTAGADLDLTRKPKNTERVLEDTDMAALFGIDMADAPPPPPVKPKPQLSAKPKPQPTNKPEPKPQSKPATFALPASVLDAVNQAAAKLKSKAATPPAPVHKPTTATRARPTRAPAPVAKPKPKSSAGIAIAKPRQATAEPYRPSSGRKR